MNMSTLRAHAAVIAADPSADFADEHIHSAMAGLHAHAALIVKAADLLGHADPEYVAPLPSVESLLVDLLESYCTQHNLPLMSADELAAEIGHDQPAHAAWLFAYCDLWRASGL